MWQNTLLWIAQARLFHPRIQAYVWLVASLFWIIPSKTFSSIIVSWSVLHIGIAFISVVLLALIPSLLPNIRINLRAVLRNDVFAIVKTLCSVIFFLYGGGEEIWRLVSMLLFGVRLPVSLIGRSSGSNRGGSRFNRWTPIRRLLLAVRIGGVTNLGRSCFVHYPHSSMRKKSKKSKLRSKKSLKLSLLTFTSSFLWYKSMEME